MLCLLALTVLAAGCERVKNTNVAENEQVNGSQSSNKLTQHGNADATERQKAKRAAMEKAKLLMNDGTEADWMAATDDERFIGCILYSSHHFPDLSSDEHGRMAKRLKKIVDDCYREVPDSGDSVRDVLALTLYFDQENLRAEIKSGQKN